MNLKPTKFMEVDITMKLTINIKVLLTEDKI